VSRDAFARAAEHADWLSVGEATAHILAAVAPLDAESVTLADALQRVLAEPVRSPIDQPPWDNSAMDGFAARADDVRAARPDAPIALRVIEEIAAGAFPERRVEPGTAIRIMTGAPVPEGADSVVRVEHTRSAGAGIVVLDGSDAGRNIRRRGEDVARRALVLEAGARLGAASLGVLASIGQATVRVHRRPRVAILSTGNELVPMERFEEVVGGRAIVDSNGWSLAAAATLGGAEPLRLGIARDEAGSVRERVLAAHGADVLVTTAGASVGDHDIVKDVLAELGYRRGFWRVRMRPGSPFSFGMLPRTDGTALPVFGLPGNPVSALVTWTVLVTPALRLMRGERAVHVRTTAVRAAEPIASKPGLAHFLRCRLERMADALPAARLTGPQGSGILTSVALADALVVVPPDRGGLDEGDVARAILLDAATSGSAEFEL
jgi:molybdopterin molybdotransferase